MRVTSRPVADQARASGRHAAAKAALARTRCVICASLAGVLWRWMHGPWLTSYYAVGALRPLPVANMGFAEETPAKPMQCGWGQ